MFNPEKWFTLQMEIFICIRCDQGVPLLIHCRGKHDFVVCVPHVSKHLLLEEEMQDQT